MATRSNIIVKGRLGSIILYHHWDGYPEGVGVELMDFVKNTTYWDAAHMATKLLQDYDGYELTTSIHGDIEYLYEIDVSEHKLTCTRMYFDMETGEIYKGNKIDLEPYYNKVKDIPNNSVMFKLCGTTLNYVIKKEDDKVEVVLDDYSKTRLEDLEKRITDRILDKITKNLNTEQVLDNTNKIQLNVPSVIVNK